jgi:ABC-2 type transport system ATP-binding protein
MSTAPPAAISTSGLTKVYPAPRRHGAALTAVDGLDLSVRPGEIFGLLGPNGAGKTTTVGMLTTRIVPTAGTAQVGGVDVIADPALAKRSIGVVHQLNTLDRSLTAWENLYFHGRYHGMSDPAARRAAGEQLERFRLSHRAQAEIRALSGGMIRRLMVARAVLHRPAVLFLDEPTANLDPQSRMALWDVLREIRDEGQTILLTTHYMEEAEEFCDRVAIMDHGRVLALDTPAGLMRSLPSDNGTGSAAEDWRRVDAALSEVVALADRLGLDLDQVRRRVTLELVFFNLTGRELRE